MWLLITPCELYEVLVQVAHRTVMVPLSLVSVVRRKYPRSRAVSPPGGGFSNYIDVQVYQKRRGERLRPGFGQ